MPGTIESPLMTTSWAAQSPGFWNDLEQEDPCSDDVSPLGRAEMIAGHRIPRMSKHTLPVAYPLYLLTVLIAAFGKAHVLPEVAIRIDAQNEPEPDAAILLYPSASLLEFRRVVPCEVALVVEVSCETRKGDMTARADLYARAAIPEYWVVSLIRKKLYVYRQPEAGIYAAVTEYTPDAALELPGTAGRILHVTDLMP